MLALGEETAVQIESAAHELTLKLVNEGRIKIFLLSLAEYHISFEKKIFVFNFENNRHIRTEST